MTRWIVASQRSPLSLLRMPRTRCLGRRRQSFGVLHPARVRRLKPPARSRRRLVTTGISCKKTGRKRDVSPCVPAFVSYLDRKKSGKRGRGGSSWRGTGSHSALFGKTTTQRQTSFAADSRGEIVSIPSLSSRVFCSSLTLCSPLESIDKTSHLVGIRCERHMQRRRQRPCEGRCQDIKHTRARKAEVNQGGGSLRYNKVTRVWVCLLFLFPHVCFLLIVSSPPTFVCVPFPLARHLTVDDHARRARARARRPPLTR